MTSNLNGFLSFRDGATVGAVCNNSVRMETTNLRVYTGTDQRDSVNVFANSAVLMGFIRGNTLTGISGINVVTTELANAGDNSHGLGFTSTAGTANFGSVSMSRA